MKQKIVHFLRKMKLLYFADIMNFFVMKTKSHNDNNIFVREHPDFITPPSWSMYQAYRHNSYRAYWTTGQDHSRLLLQIIGQHAPGSKSIADWGCGPGRVLQHLERHFETLVGFEIDENSVRWGSEYYPNIKWIKNDLSPPLAARNDEFDVVYCISVFTHLSEEMHYLWMEEISRIVRPGGIFIATFHGEEYLGKLLEHEREQYMQGNLVVRGHSAEGSRLYASFHPKNFIEKMLSKDFEILEVRERPLPSLYQTLYVTRKLPGTTGKKAAASPGRSPRRRQLHREA